MQVRHLLRRLEEESGMMGHPERFIDGDEYEALTRGGKRVHHWRAGQRAAAKQAVSRRTRRKAKATTGDVVDRLGRCTADGLDGSTAQQLHGSTIGVATVRLRLDRLDRPSSRPQTPPSWSLPAPRFGP
jgi:hypothetical protein